MHGWSYRIRARRAVSPWPSPVQDPGIVETQRQMQPADLHPFVIDVAIHVVNLYIVPHLVSTKK